MGSKREGMREGPCSGISGKIVCEDRYSCRLIGGQVKRGDGL